MIDSEEKYKVEVLVLLEEIALMTQVNHQLLISLRLGLPALKEEELIKKITKLMNEILDERSERRKNL